LQRILQAICGRFTGAFSGLPGILSVNFPCSSGIYEQEVRYVYKQIISGSFVSGSNGIGG
jgi:hypothetical protein